MERGTKAEGLKTAEKKLIGQTEGHVQDYRCRTETGPAQSETEPTQS